MAMLLKKTLTSFLLVGMVPLASLSLAACSDTASQSTESSPSNSNTAQMDHGSMDSSSPMPMDHGSMMSMDLGPADESFDLRFIDAMIPHHEGAVAMAQEALQKSNRPEIQQLAQAIIDAQEKEISELKEWRTSWYPDAGDEPMMYSAEMGHMMPMTEEMRSSMMMNGDLGAADDQFDLRFINAMIPHHQGAIDMAQQALEKSDRAEIKELAQNIIDSQQQEIDQIEQWRRNWYGQ
ncbi:DUF305 domain-containing protein [filamentous cyanobacterium CCP1]|nr:DUF305 domain-containing protein [filamentous cyanobacterium CCP2]PSB57253.1 DUF305 domain-containing protein [filamentous cyanobacterium CCP1]